MLTYDLLLTAARGITVNRTRSALTMLGIIIGVAAVVLMVSLGGTFQGYILDQIARVGTNMMEVFPKGIEKFGGKLDSLTFEDYEAVARLSTVESVTPIIILGKSAHYGTEETSPFILGGYTALFSIYGLRTAEGRLLDATDERGARNVIVIGNQVAEDLFGSRQPLGERVDIGGQSFTVVGVLQASTSALLRQLDSLIVMPFSTARALSGQKFLSHISFRTVGDPDVTKRDVTLLLRQRHRVENPADDPDKDDFIVRGAEQVTSIVGTVTLGLTIFLALVAGISLLVGGIGIMNIMLVSVTERTREIGLRKAVGAKQRDILLQFLFEALSLTLTGGVAGLVLGVFAGWFFTQVASRFLGDLSFVLSWTAVALAFAMAAGTGLVFGLYPARKAAMQSPMEALRYE